MWWVIKRINNGVVSYWDDVSHQWFGSAQLASRLTIEIAASKLRYLRSAHPQDTIVLTYNRGQGN